MIKKLNSQGSLSHWDMATEFTGEQVTALVLGEDPAYATDLSIKGAPLYQKLEKSYNAARRWHALDAGAVLDWDEIGVASEKAARVKVVVASVMQL